MLCIKQSEEGEKMVKYTIKTAVLMVIGMIVSGIYFVILEMKKGSSKKISRCIAGAFLALSGLTLLITGVIWGEQFTLAMTPIVVSICFLGFGLHHVFFVYSCSLRINATYVDANSYYARNIGYVYNPIFRYQYNGIEYEIKSLQSFSEKELKSRFAKNKVYPIYISPKKHEKCMVDKEVDTPYLLILLIGFLGLILSVYRILV